MRPVSAQFPINQAFASMRTAGVVGNVNASPDTVEYWVGRYGNYQPDGHAGCDFACPEGTPVYAMAAGTVLWADWGTKLPGDESWGPNGYFRRWALYKGFPGIVTVIQHPGWIGVYAHLSDAPLNPGDKVTEGQRIATSGSTGGVDPHLHVEALIDLSYPTGNGLIYGRTNPEPFFGSQGIAAQAGTITPLPQEDELSAQFETDARGEFDGLRGFQKDVRGALQNITNETEGLHALNVDLRGDLAKKGQQISALTATVNTLAGLVAEKQGLDVDQIKQAVAAAIADGITVTVKAGN
ncbi:M23 family metallopeptidase [Arthrobacter sp. 1P04PC]|uniref:M23 family metallopeptidase n=1 Tax=unclassified Arthrobacter TaxID=235627 RepID=UPI0039A2C23E